MSKKKTLIIGGSVFLIALVIASLALLSRGKQGEPLTQPSVQTESESVEPVLYEDEAGFSFEYPPVLGVVEQPTSDLNTYSSLELSSKEHPKERLLIKITDTSSKSVDEWLVKNPQRSKVINSSPISLGGMQGRSFKYDDINKNLVLVIDSGVLYSLEGPTDEGFWDQAFKTIVSSFRLTLDEVSNPGVSSPGNDAGTVVDEGEEVVE